ncbi:MAG: hypothetical protein WBF17_22260 [Phycisphaerae bacterium]
MVSERRKAKLLGLGLDNDDECVRITRGKNFELRGGSRDTHEGMQEKCVKFNEKLDAKGKELGDLEHREFLDMAAECKMNVLAVRREERDGDFAEK